LIQRAARAPVQFTLDHLRPTKKSRMKIKIQGIFNPIKVKDVRPQDRISFWNIAPGDKVRVIAGGERFKRQLGTVQNVDRLTNRVWLAEPKFAKKVRNPSGENFVTKAIHYSKIQLVLGIYEIQSVSDNRAILGKQLTAHNESQESRTIVATRIRTERVRWDPSARRFYWDRVPDAVRALTPEGRYEPWKIEIPKAEGIEVREGGKRIPWPDEGNQVEIPPPGPFDTSPSDALRATFRPPVITDDVPIRHTNLTRLFPELALPYIEFGNKASQKRRRRFSATQNRIRARRNFRSTKKYGDILSRLQLKRWGWRGVNWQRGIRTPVKRKKPEWVT